MTSQSSKQVIVIHILPNISRSKGTQTMKSGHLIEYNMKNVFLEKSFTKCGGETIPTPFSKISKFLISLDQWSIQFVFIECQLEGYGNILKLTCRPLAFTSYKASLKNKKRSGTSFLATFSAWFMKKNISLVILY